MTQSQALATLKTKALTQPAIGAVLTAWALRERARRVVTLRSLTITMKREGFKHHAEDYAQALKAVSEAGFGTLDLDSKGRIRALKDIKVQLQSVGKSVLGGDTVRAWRPRNRFGTLTTTPIGMTPKAPEKQPKMVKAPETKTATHAKVILARRSTDKVRVEKSPPVSILVQINGKDVVIPVPANMTAEDVGALVRNFQVK